MLIKAGDEKGWLFARYPDYHGSRLWPGDIGIIYRPEFEGGSIKNYISDVSLTEKGKEVFAGEVKVNAPLRYRGYVIYQHSYDEENSEWSELYVKKDPGIPLVYIGFLLLCGGMLIIVFKRLRGRRQL